jgi:hypothetical protein
MNKSVMKRNWTKFHGGPSSTGSGVPRVTLNKRGVILLNKAAYETFGSPPAVELMFDEDHRTIGLKPRDIRWQDAFPLKTKLTNDKRGEAHSYKYHLVYAAPFCRHFDIRPRSTMLFNGIEVDDDGTMALDLETAVVVGR